MTPLKEVLEITHPAAEPAVLPVATPPKSASSQTRSDAVSLEVPVKVHGSRVTEVVRGITPHTGPFEEEASTMIVFPEGGVVKMSAVVAAGQMLVLTNQRSNQDAICRVVKVRVYANAQSYVEVEFTHRLPGFWGVFFPSDGPELARKAASPTPASALPQKEKAPGSPNIAPPKASDVATISNQVKAIVAPPAHAVPAPASKPQSSFVSIGSQEEVQASASDAMAKRLVPPWESEGKPVVASPLPPRAAVTEPCTDAAAGPVSSSVATEPRENDAEKWDVAASAELPAASSSRRMLETFTGGAAVSPSRSALSAEALGGGLRSAIGASASQSAQPRRNWLLVAACVGFLFLGVAGTILYFRARPARNESANPAPVAAVRPAAESVPIPASQAPSGAAPTVEVIQPSVSAVAVSVNASKAVKVSADTRTEPSAPAKLPPPKVTPDMSVRTLMNAHPVSPQRQGAVQADAPSLGTGAIGLNDSPEISASLGMVAPPPALVQPEGPVRVGGAIKDPRLIHSPVPVYPAAAKNRGAQGDVVISMVIDKGGSVKEMKVVSGPSLLYQAALDAVRNWKYEPTMLDGQPIAIAMTVTVRFRL